MTHTRGYTLIELVVAVGLFAVVMTLATGGYLVMLSINQQAQGISTGINNLSFALDTMTRNIRTGSAYDCGGLGDCVAGSDSFAFTTIDGRGITYQSDGVSITQSVNGGDAVPLTDPVVQIDSLIFYTTGSARTSSSDYRQPMVVIIVAGNVKVGPNKNLPFNIETSATMRGTDI